MTRVHMISGDADFMVVRCADWPDDEALRNIELTNEPLPDGFSLRLKHIFEEPEKEGVVTDFPYMYTNGTLVFSEKAMACLAPLLKASGRIYDTTPVHDMGYKLFVCHDVRSPLDLERTDYFPEEARFGPGEIRQYAFRPEAVEDAGLFRIAGLRNRLYATDRLLERMAGQQLSGLQVRPLWSSECGALATFKYPMLEFERFPPGFGSTLREKRTVMRELIARWHEAADYSR